MDNLVFEESLNTEIDQSEFIGKKWIYVNDNNAQNYTSQVVIDSTPLSNAGGYINWQEAYILMPLVVQLTAGQATSLPVGGAQADYAWAFKSGFWHLINSMTVEFNNQNIIQQTPFLNVFRSYKNLTSWSKDDLVNHGFGACFFPDTSNSWTYQPQSNTYGATEYLNSNGLNAGLTNNVNAPINTSSSVEVNLDLSATSNQALPVSGIAGAPTLTTVGANDRIKYTGANNPNSLVFDDNSYNAGMAKRQSWYNVDNISTYSTVSGQSLINGLEAFNSCYRSGKVSQGPASTGSQATWNIYAKLRLKDICDFFEKCPLLKGSTIRFYINTNQANTTFNVVEGQIITANSAISSYPILGGNSTNNGTGYSVNINNGYTNPLMIASSAWGSGSSSLATDTYNISVSIYKNNFQAQAGFSNPQSSLTACRLYAPIYTMNPLAESKYLSLAPTKRILYNDIFQYQFSNIKSGEQFNFLVSNGINNIKSVLVVPFIGKSNGTTEQQPYDSFASPFNPAPAQPDPIMLSNFNILVSGVNLFLNNEYYDFEQFTQQLMSSNQLNGNLTTGLTSGLISESMFSNSYRYYWGNCSRVLPSEQNVSRSIQIIGQNKSLVGINIMVFVEFQRNITIDISTGARIE